MSQARSCPVCAMLATIDMLASGPTNPECAPGCTLCNMCMMQVSSLAKPQHRFKVDVNASENHLTGAAVVTDDFCIVIVEGGAHAPHRQGLALWRHQTHGSDCSARPPTFADCRREMLII